MRRGWLALWCLLPTLALAAAPEPLALTVRTVKLPGAPGPLVIDYMAFDAAAGMLWIPVASKGQVHGLDTTTGKLLTADGTFKVNRKGGRALGPSSAAVANGVLYVGNRADNKVCVLDSVTYEMGVCGEVRGTPDGIVHVPSTKELWITTPSNRALTLMDVSKPDAIRLKGLIKLEGTPEGYAVDLPHGVFFTNYVDKDKTVAVDLVSRRVLWTVTAGCGAAGPRGLALDVDDRLLFVACTDGVVSLSLAKGGKEVGRIQTGGGVDNIDYAPSTRTLFVASAKNATLTAVGVDERGQLAVKGMVPTAEGARGVMVDTKGNAFVPDGAHGQLLWVTPGP